MHPLPKICGSALANQIVSLAVIFQIIMFVNDLHSSPGSKEKKTDLPVPLYLLCKIIYEMLLTCKENPSVFKPHNIHYHSHNFPFVFALKVGIP